MLFLHRWLLAALRQALCRFLIRQLLRQRRRWSRSPWPGTADRPRLRSASRPVRHAAPLNGACIWNKATSVADRAGWKRGQIRSKMFRHTYCAARLQTLDQGAPVSIYTVARELGHGGDSMVKRVYGHLGTVRHRAEAVEYLVEQHKATLGERLSALQPAPHLLPLSLPRANRPSN